MRRLFAAATCILITIICICACSLRTGGAEVCYKQNDFSGKGMAAAYHDGRIYYVSNELGASGIYSMKEDGSDIRTEVYNPDITSLCILNDGTLMFVGLFDMNNRAMYPGTEVPTHTLYIKSPDMSAPMPVDFVDDEADVYDFCVSSDNMAVVLYNEGIYDNEKIYDLIKNQEVDLRKADKTQKAKISLNDIFSHDDLSGVLSDNEKEEMLGRKLTIYRSFYGKLGVISINGDGRTLFSPSFADESGEVLLTRKSTAAYETLMPVYSDEKAVYYAYSNSQIGGSIKILAFDRKFSSYFGAFSISGTDERDEIAGIVKSGGDIYAVIQNQRRIKDKDPEILGEKLYKISFAKRESESAYECEKGERLLCVYDGAVYSADNAGIYVTQLGDKSRSLILGTELKDFTADVSGSYLFIYETCLNGDVGRRLVCKIELGSGNVAKNDIPLDSAEMDEYRRE